jgi:glycosyltransferase involved in cell wall biosynthesis
VTLVSVCIPTYNGEEYLEQCLTSTIRQTFQNLEIIVCDDGSSDRTLDIANQIAQADRRLVIHRNAVRLGIPGNWNRCLDLAQGRWIKFMGQDDYLADDCIEVMVRAVDQTGRIVVCDRQIAYQDVDHRFQEDLNSYIAENPLHKVGETRTFEAEDISRFVLGRLNDNFIGEPVFTLFPHDVIKDVGYFDDRFVLWSDYEMWTRIAVNRGLLWLPDRLATFRCHSKAQSWTNFGSSAFRSNTVEPLLLLASFASRPEFRTLREVARQVSPEIDLSRELSQRVLALQRTTRRKASPTEDGYRVELTGLLADEYVSHVLKSFPWYQRFARRHFERPRWLGKAW